MGVARNGHNSIKEGDYFKEEDTDSHNVETK